MLNTWVYSNKEQRLLLALLLLFTAYTGSRLYLLVDVAVKKVNKVIECDTEEADPYNGIGGNNDRSGPIYDNNSEDNGEDNSEDNGEDNSEDNSEDDSEDNEDEVSSADMSPKELKSILY